MHRAARDNVVVYNADMRAIGDGRIFKVNKFHIYFK